MDSNTVLSLKAEAEDRLTVLTDDILLSILGRVDLVTAARASVLSKRWIDLPWQLSELNLCVRDFLPAPCPDPVEAQHMGRAMTSLTKATRSFLTCRSSKRIIARLSLKVYMTGNRSRDIGLLVSDAIDREMVKELDLAIVDEKVPQDCENDDMLWQAGKVHGFFSAYPSVLCCLTRLHLHNARFAKSDIHHFLFDCCRELQHLSINHCDTGDCSVWQINAPNSKLRILEVYFSCWQRVEVLCLPKLERLYWEGWFYFHAPLHFGFVPALMELCLLNPATLCQRDFSLAKLLHGTTNVNTLTLNFLGEKLWIQPEGKELRSAFSKLRKLCVHGIYVEFDLFWTINLLEAAPSVEIFDVEVYEHPCEDVTEGRTITYGNQRVKPSWEIPLFTSSNKWQLEVFQFVGFRPSLEQHILFIGAVMDHAPNLKTVLIKDYKESCERCETLVPKPSPIGGTFPRDKAEQETIVKQLRDRACWSSAQIIFSSSYSICDAY